METTNSSNQFIPQKVYFVKCEANDGGFIEGYHHFARKEDAVKLMRNHVAHRIWNAREVGNKVFVKVLRDSVMNSPEREESQSIILRIDKDLYDFRVWCADIHYTELPKNKCFNY